MEVMIADFMIEGKIRPEGNVTQETKGKQ
jgi:hypothetical protein